ncbi:unnamed protein product, partial [marine sediment metagenome]
MSELLIHDICIIVICLSAFALGHIVGCGKGEFRP